jgi:hypothetical protein
MRKTVGLYKVIGDYGYAVSEPLEAFQTLRRIVGVLLHFRPCIHNVFARRDVREIETSALIGVGDSVEI